MTATLVSPPPVAPEDDLRGKPRLGDRFFGLLAVVAALSVLAILVLIAYSTGREAWPIFSEKAGEFLFTSRWAPSENKFGALSFIFGTVVTSIIALVFAVPLSIGIALFITEVAPARLKRPVIYFLDLLAVVPSVVFGLWGILVLADPIASFYDRVGDVLGPIPLIGALFKGPASGRSFFTAGLILAIMIVPIITSITREVVATTPASEKEAAYAPARPGGR
jgi:phosphate transport system permease protein